MSRQHSTTRSGGGFDQATINAVWSKGQVVAGYDSAVYRKDLCGAWMKKTDYGTTGERGWEIDHIKPVASDGSDNLSNLQPLHWKNNRGKGDDYPNWNCSIR